AQQVDACLEQPYLLRLGELRVEVDGVEEDGVRGRVVGSPFRVEPRDETENVPRGRDGAGRLPAWLPTLLPAHESRVVGGRGGEQRVVRAAGQALHRGQGLVEVDGRRQVQHREPVVQRRDRSQQRGYDLRP